MYTNFVTYHNIELGATKLPVESYISFISGVNVTNDPLELDSPPVEKGLSFTYMKHYPNSKARLPKWFNNQSQPSVIIW